MLTAAQRRLLAKVKVSNAASTDCSPTPLHGGSIATVVRVGAWVVKTMNAVEPEAFVGAEVAGLNALSAAGCLTPEICAFDNEGLLLPYHAPVVPQAADYEAFADTLANLHRRVLPAYRSESPRFLGTLPLNNFEKSTDWTETFVNHRLRPLFNRALLRDRRIAQIDLDDLRNTVLYSEGPCLLHGDLWGGNILPTSLGLMMIDPSCWIGERGIDLAMLRLFGDLPGHFWQTYETLYPIPTTLERMLPLYQLYYGLAHVAMFGSTYTHLCHRLWTEFQTAYT